MFCFFMLSAVAEQEVTVTQYELRYLSRIMD